LATFTKRILGITKKRKIFEGIWGLFACFGFFGDIVAPQVYVEVLGNLVFFSKSRLIPGFSNLGFLVCAEKPEGVF
jgi:hypothetical protein